MSMSPEYGISPTGTVDSEKRGTRLMKTTLTSMIALAFCIGTASAQSVGTSELNVALSQNDGSEVLATVGKNNVTIGDAALTFSTLPEQMRGQPDEKMLEAITEQLISEYALMDKALEAGLEESREVKARLDAARRATLAESYITAELARRVTDETLREAYDQMAAEFPKEEEVRARHILVEEEDDAKAITKSLRETDEDFAKVAAEKSTGPSGANGGDLGYFKKGDMVAPFAEAAFSMEAGDISDPVKTRFGWHVIKVEDRRMSSPPPFDEMEPQLRQQMTQSTAQAIIAEVKAAADVEKMEETPPAFLIRRDEMYSGSK